ncbi:MAG TPA: metal ABC transporter permease [Moraxellaceae bacterium]
MSLLFDPLFRIPLFVGLLAAFILPLLGCYLRLRDEWLAALGLAHVAAACHLLGMSLHLPLLLSGGAGAVIAVALKQWLKREGNGGYALMMLGGWAALYLIAANTTLGESLSHALSDGQLYFANAEQLLALAVGTGLALALLPWWNRRLLRARFFPAHEAANQLPAWRWHLSFDLAVALLLALATGAIGLMGAFALVFLPPWLAFRLAPDWKSGLLLSALIGVAGYAAAFVLALKFDQPFGPVLVAVLLVLALAGFLKPRH